VLEDDMTTDVNTLFAAYNALANGEMNKYISQLDQAGWEREFGGYYKSIRSLCSHIYLGDIAWLKRFGHLRSFRYLTDAVFATTFNWSDVLFPAIDEYLVKRGEMDALIKSFAGELRQEDLDGTLHYRNWKNEDQSRNVGGTILHVFNHQTHHRGMISLYLDLLGKDNDFSNFLNVV
jgi:uncharacterized damage-inducible protein DinB